MIKLLITFICGFISLSGFSQVTYTVTTGASELADRIDDAVAYANTGETATIILNTGGLITINSPLPLISHTDGEIIFKKNSGDTDNEGLIAGTYDMGLSNSLSDVKADVQIIDLAFENFTKAIDFRNFNNVNIQSCSFDNCSSFGILLRYGGVLYQTLNDEILVNNNVFNNCNTAIYAQLDEAVESYPQGAVDDYSGDVVEVQNNQITDCTIGIKLLNHHNDVYANYTVKNNTLINTTSISNSFGIWFVSPRKGYVIMETNAINRFETGIKIGSEWNNTLDLPLGIDFIETPNVLGVPEKNAGNILTNCHTSYHMGGIHYDYNLIGLDVEGGIVVNRGFPTQVRDCKIEKGGSWTYSGFTPIDHAYHVITLSYPESPNNKLKSPHLISADLLSGTLSINYSTAGLGLQPENGPFVVDFYEIDNELNIIKHLGSQDVLSADGLSYSVTYESVTMISGNKVAATITSLGTVLDGEMLGTSEVSFPVSQEVNIPCEDCEKFSPTPGERYWASAWVRVDNEDSGPVKSYNNVSLDFIAFGGTTAVLTATPTGEIIDGWQRIVIDFTIPEGSEYFKVRLNADPEFDTYFDDIRIHPFNGSMKSYVYDGETFWLTSELDDNNYATFYEYDEEGGLIRIKKETARGIVTIQETHSNTIKK